MTTTHSSNNARPLLPLLGIMAGLFAVLSMWLAESTSPVGAAGAMQTTPQATETAADPAGFPPGVYRVTINLGDTTLPLTGQWVWTVRADGTYAATWNGVEVINDGSYISSDTQITLEDGFCGEVQGVYNWSFDGTFVTFTRVADTCQPRAEVLTAKPIRRDQDPTSTPMPTGTGGAETPTGTATVLATGTPAASATATETVEPTETPTVEPTGTETVEPTGTPAGTASATATASASGTPTGTASATAAATGTAAATVTATGTAVATGTAAATVTATGTAVATGTAAATAVATATGTAMATGTPVATGTPGPAHWIYLPLLMRDTRLGGEVDMP